MKVILTEKVPSLGNVGEIVNVAPGHARNFLLPKRLALVADEKNTRVLDHQNRMLKKKMDEQKKEAESIKKALNKLELVFEKKAGSNGKLFGSITTAEIVENILKETQLEIERRVLSVDRPIKQIGDYLVKAKLFKDVEAEFKVKVSMDPKQLEEMKLKQAEREKEKKLKLEKEAQEAKEANENDEKSEEKEVDSTENNS